MKYWITATGRDNWFPYSEARICSLHFTENDYYHNKEDIKRRRLKPDVIPTQNVHASILQVFQQDTNILQMSQLEKVNKINKCEQDSTEIMVDQEHDEIIAASPKCLNCDKLLYINEQLKEKIFELEESVEKRLNQQADMFRKLINDKELALKKKLETVRNNQKSLNRNIQRKRKKITNLKTVFKKIKRQKYFRE